MTTIRMRDLLAGALDDLRYEPTPKWIRATVGDRTVVDSRAAVLVWEPRRVVPSYAVPAIDIAAALVPVETPAPAESASPTGRPRFLTPGDPFAVHTTPGTPFTVRLPDIELPGAAFVPDDPVLSGVVLLDWRAFTGWSEEDQPVIAHPHDPFKRIDCLRSTRHVVVRHGDVVLADTRRATLLFETGLRLRYYIPPEDVATDLLEPTDSHTVCAYKGRASYWSARIGGEVLPDVAWAYEDPLPDAVPVRGLVAFYTEQLDVTADDVVVG